MKGLPTNVSEPTKRRIGYHSAIVALTSLLLGATFLLTRHTPSMTTSRHHNVLPECPIQPAPLAPAGPDWRPDLDADWLRASAKRLGDAVRIPTISEDDMSDADLDRDPRYKPFISFRRHLQETYPNLHKSHPPKVINHHALLYEIQGSDPSLKPSLFLAHQDVVPVPESTLHSWTYPPFSGHYEILNKTTADGFIWGRGSSDDKNMLVGIFEAFEYLISNGTYPSRRTFYIALGFDEEIGGPRGATSLGEYLQRILGSDSLEFILDEGGLGLGLNSNDIQVAQIAMAEKGYLDVKLEIKMSGGHSSIPFDHTAIGVMAKILVQLEANPHQPVLDENNPMLVYYSCVAGALRNSQGSSREELPPTLTGYKLTPSFIRSLTHGDWATCANEIANHASRMDKYLLSTSQAIDVISGGQKANALPESVTALINHRVRMGETVESVVTRLRRVIQPVVEEFNLTWVDDDDSSGTSNSNSSSISLAVPLQSDPTPISPTDTHAWTTLAGTIRHVFDPATLVTPAIMTGNTDSRHLLNLSRNVWRWNPNRYSMLSAKHTVNEKMDLRAHAETARFVWALVRNAGW